MARDLIDVATAREIVLEEAKPLGTEEVPLRRALGRVLAADVRCDEAIPPFDNSAMDGYAVRARDTAGAARGAPLRLAVVDESRAGHPARSSAAAGQAIAISTGAAIPDGCDAVVRLEEASSVDGAIEIDAPVEPGRDVRRAGDDVKPGELVLPRGAVLGPAELGVLASLGRGAAICGR